MDRDEIKELIREVLGEKPTKEMKDQIKQLIKEVLVQAAIDGCIRIDSLNS